MARARHPGPRKPPLPSPLTAATVSLALPVGLEVSNALASPAIVSRGEMVASVTARIAGFFKTPRGPRNGEHSVRGPGVANGKALDRKGSPLLIKLKGKVEAFYR